MFAVSMSFGVVALVAVAGAFFLRKFTDQR